MVRLRGLRLSRHPDRQPVLRQRRCQRGVAQDLCRVRRGLRLAAAGRHRLRCPGRPTGAQAHPVADHPADGRLHHADRPAAHLRQHRPRRAGAADPGALPAGLFRRRRVRRGLRLPDGARTAQPTGVLWQFRAGLDLFRIRLRGGDRLWPGSQPVGRSDEQLGLARAVSGGRAAGAGGVVPALAHGRNPGLPPGAGRGQGP